MTDRQETGIPPAGHESQLRSRVMTLSDTTKFVPGLSHSLRRARRKGEEDDLTLECCVCVYVSVCV